MAVLTVQNVGFDGLDEVVFTAASSGGDSFPNNGRVALLIKNDDVSSKTVTVNSQQSCSQGHDHDIALAVGAGNIGAQGTFPTGRFNDNNGQVTLTYSAVTDLFVAVIAI